MAEIASHRAGSELGCGFMGGIFQKWNHWPKKSHVHSLPPPPEKPNNNNNQTPVKVKPLRKKVDQQTDKNLPPKPRSSTSSSSNSSGQNHPENIPRKDSVQLDDTKPQQLRKLKLASKDNNNINNNNTNSSRATSVTSNSPGSAARSAVVLGACGGNIVRRKSCGDEIRPEALKKMGNEAYKQGRFKEALVWYDKAIVLDSNQAVYRSNRGAALIGLGRLVEAISECREAIRIEPSYHRAHHRLATLYLRLGGIEKALYHYKLSGSYATPSDIDKAQALQNSLVICNEAKKLQKWSVLLDETQRAISSGANSAPLVFALQAEALLKLLRHEEAYKAYQNGPNLSIDVCTNFFGMTSCAYFLMIGSHAYLAVGRFEESVVAAQEAEKLDPSNKEASAAVKRARAVSTARSIGNVLFKEEKFSQACTAYSHGLEQDPHNSVLLSNRAACNSKLSHFEIAIEDCTAALRVHPSYTKARLRRAHCYAKLERWEDSVQDYQVLIKESPEDEEVVRALFEARIQLKRQCGEETMGY